MRRILISFTALVAAVAASAALAAPASAPSTSVLLNCTSPICLDMIQSGIKLVSLPGNKTGLLTPYVLKNNGAKTSPIVDVSIYGGKDVYDPKVHGRRPIQPVTASRRLINVVKYQAPYHFYFTFVDVGVKSLAPGQSVGFTVVWPFVAGHTGPHDLTSVDGACIGGAVDVTTKLTRHGSFEGKIICVDHQ